MYIAMDVNRSGLELGLENDSMPWIDKSGYVQCIGSIGLQLTFQSQEHLISSFHIPCHSTASQQFEARLHPQQQLTSFDFVKHQEINVR